MLLFISKISIIIIATVSFAGYLFTSDLPKNYTLFGIDSSVWCIGFGSIFTTIVLGFFIYTAIKDTIKEGE